MKKSLICAGGGGFLWGLLVSVSGEALGVPFGLWFPVAIIGAIVIGIVVK